MKFFFTLGMVFAATLPTLRAIPPDSPSDLQSLEVIAKNGADRDVRNVSENGVVPMVLVRPNQAIPVTLQFPTDKAGTPVATTALDGGKINGGTPAILPTGRFIFTFSPGPVPGRYRLMVHAPGEQHLLEFYVVDPSNPPFKSRASRN